MTTQLSLKKKSKLWPIVIAAIPLLLSAYTHLWNPAGFPSQHVDEGHYLRKAVSTEKGQGLQPQNRYLAPYFGQMFLAGIFKIISYPNFLIKGHIDGTSIQQFFMIPRVLMGILAIIDTFLIYKISQRRYGDIVALAASILFAVMPFTWMTRRVLLESIQLPFILTSIMLIIYSVDIKQHKKTAILISGIFMGLAIFTKIPAFTAIPLVAFLTYFTSRRLKYVLLWIIPTILIPALWPIHAAAIGDLNSWVNGILYQTGRESRPLINALNTLFQVDPIFFIIGIGGVIYSVFKRDYFLIIWTLPIFIFLQLIGYVSSFHLISLLPPLCIAGGRLIAEIGNRSANKKVRNVLPFVRISAIGLFGLISLSMIISIDMNSTYYKALAFLVQELPDAPTTNSSNSDIKSGSGRVTLSGNPEYFWVPQLIFNKQFEGSSYYSNVPFKTDKFIMIIDKGFLNVLNSSSRSRERLALAVNATQSLSVFQQNLTGDLDTSKYPYTNLKLTPESKYTDIRSNY
ncbi:MAG: glycosyltransferase family 39 protein [Thermoproteota archaeon]|nr:glycosyltransferase family 39 protein [Thermoproteota archaeon]